MTGLGEGPRSVRALVAAALLVATLSACGAPSADPATGTPGDRAPLIQPRRAATLEALLGPWQAVPYQLDQAFRARADAACRTDMQGRPGPAISLVDARGGAVVTVRSRGADMTVCHALQLLPTGDFIGAGSGENGSFVEQAPTGAWDLEFEEAAAIEGGDLKVQGWSVHGKVGPGIALVIIRPALGQAAVATLENGWFAAWWPVQLEAAQDIRLLPRFTIDAYDAAGDLRATVTR